jgi:hypothetical protein
LHQLVLIMSKTCNHTTTTTTIKATTTTPTTTMSAMDLTVQKTSTVKATIALEVNVFQSYNRGQSS